MGLLETVGVLVFGGGIAAFCGLVGVGYLQTYWRVRKSDPTDARRIRESGRQVELVGTVRAHEDVPRSPFSETKSPVYEWNVSEEKPRDRDSEPLTLDFGEVTEPFVLDDGTGDVLIRPEGAQLELDNETTVSVDPDESPPSGVATYIEETNGLPRDHDETRHYRESRLDLGADVHVYGPVREATASFDHPAGVDAVVGLENPEERTIRLGEDDLSTIVEKVKSDDARFVVSDGDKAEAERELLHSGLVWLVFGLAFGGFTVVAAILG
jgi:hypothetical protein